MNGTGKGFSWSPLDTPVEIRWNGPSGQTLASTRPDLLSDAISFSFKVPDGAKPGYYVVVATQYNAMGRQVAGTPARAVIRVTSE